MPALFPSFLCHFISEQAELSSTPHPHRTEYKQETNPVADPVIFILFLYTYSVFWVKHRLIQQTFLASNAALNIMTNSTEGKCHI